MEYNDTNAKVILDEDRYPDGANFPTRHIEYLCPCGNGKIVNERIMGFGENYAFIECSECKRKYEIITGCGYFWQLEEKD